MKRLNQKKHKLFSLIVITLLLCSLAAIFVNQNRVQATSTPSKMLRFGWVGTYYSQTDYEYATHLDIIEGFVPWLSAIDHLKDTNPNIIILQYDDVAGVGSEYFSIFQTNNWLLKDSSNNYLHYGDNYIWDYGNSLARQWVANYLLGNMNAHHSLNGVLFDNFQVSDDVFYNIGFYPPINPRTGSAWIDSDVCIAMKALVNLVVSTTGGSVFVNGVNNGYAYSSRASLWNDFFANSAVTGSVSEQLFEYAPYSGSTENWVSEAWWQNSLNYISYLQNNWMTSGNKYQVTIAEDSQPDQPGTPIMTPYENGVQVSQQRFMTFQFASELLSVKNNYPCLVADKYAFNSDNFFQSLFSNNICQNLGTSSGDYFMIPGTHIYEKNFSGGIVLVNPSTSDYSTTIGAGYTNAITGDTVSSTVTLPAHNGLVLYHSSSPSPTATPTATSTSSVTPTSTLPPLPTPTATTSPTSNDFLITTYPFVLTYSTGGSFAIQSTNPSSIITFTVTSGNLNGTGNVNAGNNGGAFQILPTTSGTLLITTSGSPASVYIDGVYANNIPYDFFPGDPLITWTYGSSPIIINGNGIQYYFRSETYTTLGVSGNGFDSDYTNNVGAIFKPYIGTDSITYAFQVYLFSSPTRYTELTSGPSASMLITSNYTGTSTATINIDKTDVTLGYQALQIKLLEQYGSGSWVTVANFISPVLITDSIKASTWVFNLNINQTQTGGNTYSTVNFGNSQYQSGVSNIVFSTPKESEIQAWRLSHMDLVGFELASYIDEIGSAFYALVLLLFAAVLYFRYGHFGTVAFFFILFGGSGGLLFVFFGNAMWIVAPAAALIILGTTWLVWRLIR